MSDLQDELTPDEQRAIDRAASRGERIPQRSSGCCGTCDLVVRGTYVHYVREFLAAKAAADAADRRYWRRVFAR